MEGAHRKEYLVCRKGRGGEQQKGKRWGIRAVRNKKGRGRKKTSGDYVGQRVRTLLTPYIRGKTKKQRRGKGKKRGRHSKNREDRRDTPGGQSLVISKSDPRPWCRRNALKNRIRGQEKKKWGGTRRSRMKRRKEPQIKRELKQKRLRRG